MRIVIVGNDLRTVALSRVLIAEGHEVIAIPGLVECSIPGLISRPLRRTRSDEPLWQQVRHVDEIVDTVNHLTPHLVVCLHVESSDAGLVDALIERPKGFQVFGVRREACRIETSKEYGYSIAQASGLAVPASQIIRSCNRYKVSDQNIRFPQWPLVIKADGLAGGHGTVIAQNSAELLSAFESLPAGDLLIQEYVPGHEFALSLMCQGRHVTVLNVNFEFKRAYDRDRGPNTPGMGTVARNGIDVGSATHMLGRLPDVLESIGYCGPLDISFMLDPSKEKPVFLEFTARFGDPELSSEILLLNDVSELLSNVAQGVESIISFRPHLWAVGVVAKGGSHRQMDCEEEITHDTMLIPKGNESCFSGVGNSLDSVLRRTYSILKKSVSSETIFRSDIGHNALSRWEWFEKRF